MAKNRDAAMLPSGPVQLTIERLANCPCSSGRPFIQCCKTPEGWMTKAASTAPIGGLTGLALAKCYASCLGDCSQTISREHFISQSILAMLAKTGPQPLTAHGLSWLSPGEAREVSPTSLAAKILCDRHNGALSNLDTIACRLFGLFREDRIGIYLFNGHDIERWLLKALCGAVFSRSVIVPVEWNMDLPPRWMRVLFGLEDFGPNEGLYVSASAGSYQGSGGVELTCLAREGVISGASIRLCGRELILSMVPLEEGSIAGVIPEYRPQQIHTKIRQSDQRILFTWDGPVRKATLHLRSHGYS